MYLQVTQSYGTTISQHTIRKFIWHRYGLIKTWNIKVSSILNYTFQGCNHWSYNTKAIKKLLFSILDNKSPITKFIEIDGYWISVYIFILLAKRDQCSTSKTESMKMYLVDSVWANRICEFLKQIVERLFGTKILELC